jgi:uncharacterized protein YukE
MSQDLNVNIQDLEKFLNALTVFQDAMHDRVNSLEASWNTCDESWQGEAKQEFEKEFSPTLSTMNSALKAGNESAEWLQKFHELVERFERR